MATAARPTPEALEKRPAQSPAAHRSIKWQILREKAADFIVANAVAVRSRAARERRSARPRRMARALTRTPSRPRRPGRRRARRLGAESAEEAAEAADE